MKSPASIAASLALLALALPMKGCVRRQLTVTSEPAGAIVYLNNREAGRTPFTTDFVWYGTYDVVVRKEGYETLNARSRVLAPWWGVPPIDLFAEMMPWRPTDRKSLSYVLSETPGTDAKAIVERGRELQRQLPATQPTAAR